MTVPKVSYSNSRCSSNKPVFRLRAATVVMLILVTSFSAIALGWLTGQGQIIQLFAQLHVWQRNPPMWLEAPMVTQQHYLLLPTVILMVVVLGVTKLSPRPCTWSRNLVVGILLALLVRYLLWRIFSTLNLVDPLNGVFSLGLFLLEMLLLTSSLIQLFLMLRVKKRSAQASQLSLDVISGRFNPSVDILIPTYNEPCFILKRTIMGCQGIDYDNKNVYLLDDTKRQNVKELAAELGCNYITRPDNSYAKAGNLNHAIPKTSGDLIVLFDADFVPTKNFLTRTVGFFKNSNVGLVQTPQSFYNPDPIAYNLGLEDVLLPEEEVFYRQVQPIRDGAGGVVCAGTSFVVKRDIIEAAGGFVTDSLTEDYFTGIRIAAMGYQVIYLDEKLSAGLAAENIAAHVAQRLRWAQGTLQAFFIDANPLTIPGLKPIQRLAHLDGLLNWFTGLSRFGFLLMPLAYSFLGVIPLQATPGELLYFLLPYYLIQLTVFSWLNLRSRSGLLSDIYSLPWCVPMSLTVIQVMLNPFGKGFKVTPKGVKRDRFVFNSKLGLPLIILFIATAVSLWQNLSTSVMYWGSGISATDAKMIQGLSLGWIWSIYNLIMLGIALLIVLDVPNRDLYQWFKLRRVVRLEIGNQTVWGMTTKISEIGAQVALTEVADLGLDTGNTASEPLPVELEMIEEKLHLSGVVTEIDNSGEEASLRIMFDPLTLQQHRTLVEMLFCRPGRWQRRESPSEMRSLLLLFRILLKPRVLFDRQGRS
ncbi:MAG: glycosyltransferase [Moorea sp. SIO4G3]|nr:glycosyltransferase [Moorena sp. SIO4G3]